MDVFVNGVKITLGQEHEYELGPLRLYLRDTVSDAYNRVVTAWVEALTFFAEEHGHPWTPSFNIEIKCSDEDLALYRVVGTCLNEILSSPAYNWDPNAYIDLDQMHLFRVEKL